MLSVVTIHSETRAWVQAFKLSLEKVSSQADPDALQEECGSRVDTAIQQRERRKVVKC